MATIGQITVNVLANTKGFAVGMQKSRSELDLTEKKTLATSKAFGLLTKGLAAVGGAVAAGGVIGGLRKTANEMDHLAKTSDKLGITTERLAGLTHAASLSGVESGKLEMSLQRLTRRSAEAAQGTGEAVSALKELNIDAGRFNKLSPDEKMYRLADAFQGTRSQADRVRIAFKLFDSEGVDLVNTLALGSAGLKDMQAEADKLGLSFSREEAAKIEKFNDELARLGSMWNGFKRDLVIDIAPAAAEAVEGLRLVLDKVGKKDRGIFKPLRDGANENNSLIYKGTDSLLQWMGVGMGGNDALTDAERQSLDNRRSATINAGIARRQDVMSNFRRSGAWKDSKTLDAERHGLMIYIRKQVGETSDTAKKFLDTVREKTPGLLDSIHETARNVEQASRTMWLKQAATQLGFRFGPSDRGAGLLDIDKAKSPSANQNMLAAALERNTAAGYSASRIRNSPEIKIQQEQLVQQKRTTNAVEKIANKPADVFMIPPA